MSGSCTADLWLYASELFLRCVSVRKNGRQGRPTMIDNGRPWSTMVDHGRPSSTHSAALQRLWSTMVERFLLFCSALCSDVALQSLAARLLRLGGSVRWPRWGDRRVSLEGCAQPPPILGRCMVLGVGSRRGNCDWWRLRWGSDLSFVFRNDLDKHVSRRGFATKCMVFVHTLHTTAASLVTDVRSSNAYRGYIAAWTP